MGGPADPIAPTIIIPPKNTSVMVGTFEVTLECVANARCVWALEMTSIKLLKLNSVYLFPWGSCYLSFPACVYPYFSPSVSRPLIKLSITWRKNGVLVNRGLRDFGRRLTISGPLLSDSGYYECEASLRSSSAPSVTAGAYMHVLGKNKTLFFTFYIHIVHVPYRKYLLACIIFSFTSSKSLNFSVF